MGVESIAFIIDVVVTSLCVFLAASLRSAKIPWLQLFLILFVVSSISLLPYVGYVIAMAVFVYLLDRYTDLHMADAIWVVVISKCLAMTLLLYAGMQWGDSPTHFLTFSSHWLSNFLSGA